MNTGMLTIGRVAEGLIAPILSVLWLTLLSRYLFSIGSISLENRWTFELSIVFWLGVLSFIFGAFKRKFYLFGLLPFFIFSLMVRFLFEDYYFGPHHQGLIVQASMSFLTLMFCIPGFIAGWLLRVCGEWAYAFIGVKFQKKTV